MKMSVASNREI